MPRMSDNALMKKGEQHVLYIRHETTVEAFSELIGDGFMHLGTYLEELGEMIAGEPYVCYLDFENMAGKTFVLEITFPVSKPYPGKGDILSKSVPEEKVAFAYYRGHYNDMPPFYDDLIKWIKERGLRLKGDVYEYYLNGPHYPMEDMLTRVVMPLL